MLFTDRLVQRKNNQLPSQAGDKDGWPIFVIANLHGHDRPREELVQFRFESTRAHFNVTKAPRDPASCIENGSAIIFA